MTRCMLKPRSLQVLDILVSSAASREQQDVQDAGMATLGAAARANVPCLKAQLSSDPQIFRWRSCSKASINGDSAFRVHRLHQRGGDSTLHGKPSPLRPEG